MADEPYDPHIRIKTLDGHQHIIPESVFIKIIIGRLSLLDIDDYDIIIRSIISEWLTNLKEKYSMP